MGDKIKVLVLPGLYPEYEGDPKGSFVPDYIRSVQPWCDITVLHIRARGNPGMQETVLHGIPVMKYGITTSGLLVQLLKPFFYTWLFYKGVRMARRMEGIQLIHAHGTSFNGLLAVLIARFIPAATVITEHTPPYKIRNSPLLRKCFSYAVKHADVFLSVSDDQLREFMRLEVKPKKAIVTYNPVDTNLFHSGNNPPASFRNIVFAGRLVKYKGVKRLIQAFIKIAPVYTEWKMTICGNGPSYNEYHRMVAAAGLQHRIFFVPLASRHVIAEEFRRSSFLAFPSEHETFGLVIAEAMSAGLPVLTSNVTAPPEQINKQNGIVVNPFSEKAIREGLEEMIGNFMKYDSDAIRSEVVSKYGIEAFGEKLIAIYRNCLKQDKQD